MIDIFTII